MQVQDLYGVVVALETGRAGTADIAQVVAVAEEAGVFAMVPDDTVDTLGAVALVETWDGSETSLDRTSSIFSFPSEVGRQLWFRKKAWGPASVDAMGLSDQPVDARVSY